jgi:hypothetical protein
MRFVAVTAVAVVAAAAVAAVAVAGAVAAVSVCGSGLCVGSRASGCVAGTEPACGCVTSQPGALCRECGFAGYLSSVGAGTCVCALAYFDPTKNCTAAVSYASTLSVATRAVKATCTAWASRLTGFFAQPDDAAHTYGEPDPPLVTQCLSPVYGPGPDAFVDSLVPGTTLSVCNTLGGADPNAVGGQNDTSFVTCAGHGLWDAAAYRCAGCYVGWELENTDYTGPDGNTVPLCSACAPWFGPPPPYAGDAVAPTRGPYCVVPWTPDNVTGVSAECGGRGVFTASGCSCFAVNGTLANLTDTFGVLAYTSPTGTATALVSVVASVETCA